MQRKRVSTLYGSTTAILSMLMVTVFSGTVSSIEERVGQSWGLPILALYFVLLLVFFTQKLRSAKRVRELETRRRIEE
ncbi:MAG: hypothetical protein PF636_04515 [Actinomycetota bacterium]|jgi:SNF family Na+-dependent transporter|nr:hypothetical protein [Actinomycetota bacterium]